MTTYADRIATPLGELFAVVNDGALVRLDFVDSRDRPHSEAELAARVGGTSALEWNARALRPVRTWLERYFAGRFEPLELPLAPIGTAFQKAVWDELCRIPPGETCSYRDLARRIERPRAIRAVGRANATNPIALVVPCHRVIGASGALTGYAGGIERKRALLELEGALTRRCASERPSATSRASTSASSA